MGKISSLSALNCTQFVGALNDNIYKLLLVYFLIELKGQEHSSKILSFVGGLYVLPFIFFSTTAGWLADRYSKQSIIVITRSIEVVTLLTSVMAFLLQDSQLGFICLLFMGLHSAIFGPCKYGIIPEIVEKEAISQANGLITACSYIAIIVGTFLASFLTDISENNFALSVGFSIVFSIFSLIASFFIKHTPPSGSKKRFSCNIVKEIAKTVRFLKKEHPRLLITLSGSAFFLFMGSFVQLNIIPYAIYKLELSEVHGGYLFLLTALGIGFGSLTAGKLSHKTVELGIVPIGGIGLVLSCFLLDFSPEKLPIIALLTTILGFFGGLYLVPLDAYTQTMSPPEIRGELIACSNFFGFFGVLISAILLYFLSVVLELEPDTNFTVIGSVALVIMLFISWIFKKETLQFMRLSKKPL